MARSVETDGKLHKVVAQLYTKKREVEEQKRVVDRLRAEAEFQATHDALTGLLNRRAWFDLAAEIDPAAVVIFDIDHFKLVNDTHGHPEGDRVLSEVADRLSAAFHDAATLARLGGEEFGAYLYGTAAEAAARAEEAVAMVAAAPIRLSDGTDLAVTISGGLAAWRDEEGTAAQVLADAYDRADQALYAAKESGRALLDGLEELPPVPAVAAHVMAIVADDRSSATDLSEVIATDHALTAKLLRMSNSAYYSFARPVENVRDAVTLLGVRQVREVAVTMSLMDAFESTEKDSDFDLELFWAHSVAVAVIAEGVAAATRLARPADAFTAGIVHDIGRLVLHQARPEQFLEAVADASDSGRALAEAETERTGFSHAGLGRALGERWNFPAALVNAVGSHHNEALSREEGRPLLGADASEPPSPALRPLLWLHPGGGFRSRPHSR